MMRGISFSAGEEHLIWFPSTKPFISARSSKVQLTPAESSGTLWASRTNCRHKRDVLKYAVQLSFNNRIVFFLRNKRFHYKKCMKVISSSITVLNQSKNNESKLYMNITKHLTMNKNVGSIVQLWPEFAHVIVIMQHWNLHICEHLGSAFEQKTVFEHDHNTILLMRGTVARSVQINDPSAGQSVARGATGGSLSGRLID